ncbi:hypothetical protein BDK61_0979 [Haloarcula quadrata]|uniref:Uncharacterized protein n=1 Tax=Haloarcula quadrata TaxID=182779 RepID=A0A495R2X3_9EURY|nr:hypothetical protein [Haloarcula quadrata]RKS81685.1 hypothetical protein BDK61_0979 [Haloarcula quadrata]
MPSSISNTVFSEPSGPRIALIHFAGSLVFAGLYVSAWSTDGSAAATWLLAMVVGTGLAGIAEALPKHRRQLAGVLRSIATLVFFCIVVAALVVPGFLGI